MKNPKKTSRFGGIWKALALSVILGYWISNVLAFDLLASTTDTETSVQGQLDSNNIFMINEVKKLSPKEFPKQVEESLAQEAKGIWENLVTFMQSGLRENKNEQKTHETVNTTSNTQNQTQVNNPEKPQIAQIIHVLPQSENQILPFFTDISDDENKESIEILASIGIFETNDKAKFYPKNHVRYSDFIRVLIDIYRYKQGILPNDTSNLETEEKVTNHNYQNLLSRKINTAKKLGMLENIPENNLENVIGWAQAKQIFNNTILIDPHSIDKEKMEIIDTYASTITKSEMSYYFVELFSLQKKEEFGIFRDISGHPLYHAIMQLAQLGVVAGKNGNFYPDNYTVRADGISMLANSLAASKGKAIIIREYTHINNINDVTYFAPYAPHLEYLLQNNLWASLLYPQESGTLFLPNAMLTKGEAYQLINESSQVKIINMNPDENTKPITRWELASLIVQSFDFDSPLFTQESSQDKPKSPKEHEEEKKNLLLSLLKVIIEEQ